MNSKKSVNKIFKKIILEVAFLKNDLFQIKQELFYLVGFIGFVRWHYTCQINLKRYLIDPRTMKHSYKYNSSLD